MSINSQVHRQSDPISLSAQVLERGQDHIVSFADTSQFTVQGVSACGLAAFNFARIAFRIEQDSEDLPHVLNELSTRDVIEEIVAICAGWSSNMHLEADDIHNLPIFGRSLKLASIKYGRPHPKHFRNLLQNVKSMEQSAVIIITRPPEIIACLKLVNSTLDDPVFVIFDSHPRPSHPHGAGLLFSASIENTARALSDILPTMDEDMFNSSDFQWQAQLLGNCSSHVYVTRRRHNDHEGAIIRSSLAILDLRTQISALKSENKKLDSDNKQFESEVDRLRTCIRQEEQAKAKNATSTPLGKLANSVLGRSFGLISHAIAGPSRTSRLSDPSPVAPLERARPSSFTGTAGAQSIFAHNPPPVPSQLPPSCEEGSSPDSDDDDLWAQSDYLARQLGNKFESEDQQLGQQHARLARQLQNEFDSEDRQSRQEHTRLALELQNEFDAEDQWLRQEHARLALQLQNEFDAEDRQLRQEQAELVRCVQATFKCGICLDELPEDDVAKVDDCVHMMCRSCLREFVSSKIQEHRYPILCPVCAVDAQNKARPGVISRFLIEELGITEEQYQVLTEMELTEYTIQIHCRKCRRPAFVDRQDYSEVFNIVCPQSDCNHVWCKKCEQTIVFDGPKHSCDGSSELDHLMKEKGWKHCPNCTTPIQKASGCNHMACISPGCNTHFCYICGGMIVRSALNHDISPAVSAHFRRCQLFEVPES